MKEARTDWIPINSQLREEVVFKSTITELLLQDERFHWGSFNSYPHRVFRNLHSSKRPYEFPNDVHISITLEVELDLQVIERQVYNILDWIGDIGGLGEGCFFISFTILGVIHFGALDNMIINELFRVDKNLEEDVAAPAGSGRAGQVTP